MGDREDSNDNEKQPLLQLDHSQSNTADAKETQATVSPIGPDELPPPFYQNTSLTGVNTPMVTCRVCQAMIDISGKQDQHVVKCSQCNEATIHGKCNKIVTRRQILKCLENNDDHLEYM